ncbi:hypothetical protein Xcel_1530 [Xylanimonas cellulosilytica DSM 15894]|uniref:Uncharacterized protein n=1 Tax=Xylanimonas cellulosilytica (strain DSM 15894 / JCM 12276 / CECT 5975 / KCTC 9989 / LMG 20990 / NBRC 107835 / XIL07) TaxID=446471 RepID=D1BS68_XYLCX|nr:hypothetical protein Xcel_1530 [Xylanimonas cellulosilytica DSM 15894]
MTGEAKGLPDIVTMTPPWSATQLRKLGKSLRDGAAPAPGAPGYEDVIVWYGDLTYTSGLAEVEAAFRRMELDGGERDA